MPRYQPILKAKPAEFSAWEHSSPSVRAASDPLFELSPGIAKDPSKADVTLRNYLSTFVVSATRSFAASEVVTVDASTLAQSTPWAQDQPRIIPWLSAELARESVTMRPVVRLADPAIVLADAAAAAVLHGRGVTVRLGNDANDPDLPAFAAGLQALLSALMISADQLHILLDFRYVASAKDVSRATPVLDAWLKWLALAPVPFGSVYVGSGAFPATISGLKVATSNLIRRWDADFYPSSRIPAGLDVGYADYAVNHPITGEPIPRAPLPSMRYLFTDDWLVWRESKSAIGNEAFFTVCQAIVAHPAWAGTHFSWGDEQIERSSRRQGGAGTATQWRAYGTSHHVEAVVDRLANLGAP
jgi:hypothetical protein